jgi:hypothetical protein
VLVKASLRRSTASALFGDEDTPVTWIVLNIEFFEDFVKDGPRGGTITYIYDSSLSVVANELCTILDVRKVGELERYLPYVIDTHDPSSVYTGDRFLMTET